MKKLLTLVCVLFFTLSISAQSKQEKIAKRNTDIATEVLSLNKETSAKVYAIQLVREQKSSDIKKTTTDDKISFKVAIKKLNKSTAQKMTVLLGTERFKKIMTYKREQREKKKKN